MLQAADDTPAASGPYDSKPWAAWLSELSINDRERRDISDALLALEPFEVRSSTSWASLAANPRYWAISLIKMLAGGLATYLYGGTLRIPTQDDGGALLGIGLGIVAGELLTRLPGSTTPALTRKPIGHSEWDEWERETSRRRTYSSLTTVVTIVTAGLGALLLSRGSQPAFPVDLGFLCLAVGITVGMDILTDTVIAEAASDDKNLPIALPRLFVNFVQASYCLVSAVAATSDRKINAVWRRRAIRELRSAAEVAHMDVQALAVQGGLDYRTAKRGSRPEAQSIAAGARSYVWPIAVYRPQDLHGLISSLTVGILACKNGELEELTRRAPDRRESVWTKRIRRILPASILAGAAAAIPLVPQLSVEGSATARTTLLVSAVLALATGGTVTAASQKIDSTITDALKPKDSKQ